MPDTPCKDSPCKNCDRKGLPILFTRYAAAYSAPSTVPTSSQGETDSKSMTALRKLMPKGKFKPEPDGVSIKKAVYNVRMLRPGYLYTRMVHRSYDLPVWRGYIVHPHGYLAEFAVSQPQEAKTHPACEMETRGANMSLVWVEDAENVTEFHYMFHPDLLNFEHLKKEIEPNRGKYMKKFDLAGWATGGNTQQDHTCLPDQLNEKVVEFAALTNEDLRNGIEPQLHGLMGANAIERAWGDWEEGNAAEVAVGALQQPLTPIRMVQRKGSTYDEAHGPRLRRIIKFLKEKKGAVIACSDPTGIAQELGHLQAEVQSIYTRWQMSHADGMADNVTNEWVLQSATGAYSLMDLVKKGAVASVDKGLEESSRIHAPLPRDPQQAVAERSRRAAARERNYFHSLTKANQAIEDAFNELFDQARAKEIMNEQQARFNSTENIKTELGADQVRWLHSDALKVVIGRYSHEDEHINTMGGGAGLRLELAQCMAGSEHNEAGRKWLQDQALWSDDVLAQTLCFGNKMLKKTSQEVDASTHPPAVNPGPEPTTALADSISAKLKLLSGRMALGDKALAFLETAPSIADSAALRKAAWPLHIASLMSVKMMQTINNLPVTKAEAMVVRYVALTGLSSLGKNSEEYFSGKRPEAQKQAKKIGPQLTKIGKTADAGLRAPNARAAGLAALFDLGQAILKGRQLSVKGDVRTGMEMMGNVLQGIGSIVDWRAKVYEETIYKAAKQINLFTHNPIAVKINEIQLLKLRVSAFKFLFPATVISVYWDIDDLLKSIKRKNPLIGVAQIASIVGATFTILSVAMAASGALLGIAELTWASIGATLGLIGAVISVASILLIFIISEPEWKNWLNDNPLSLVRKGKPPIHSNLMVTLQELANSQKSI